MKTIIQVILLVIGMGMIPSTYEQSSSAAPTPTATENYEAVALKLRDTVSHVTFWKTQRASNWQKNEIVAVNPKTGKVYPKNQYNRLPVGTEVRVPKSLVTTYEYRTENESLASFVGRFESEKRDVCFDKIKRINQLSDPNADVDHILYVPSQCAMMPKIVDAQLPPPHHDIALSAVPSATVNYEPGLNLLLPFLLVVAVLGAVVLVIVRRAKT